MRTLIRFAAITAVWIGTALLWLLGWCSVLALALWFGPQDPFDRTADIWVVLGLVGMTGVVVVAGLRMTRMALRRIV